MERNNRKRGFTLVELIVVLVILAVLAALLVPSLTGYIDKAKKKAVITEARDVWTASQAALSECYALYPESFTANSANNKSNCRFSVYINNKWVENVGKISNAALNALQKNPKDTVEAGTASRRVSAMVLAYLDSADTVSYTHLTLPTSFRHGVGVFGQCRQKQCALYIFRWQDNHQRYKAKYVF